MAQVIRKFLDGGKPVVIKIDNNDYAYNDIEDKIWKNFNDYAKYNNWDKETTKVVREYLNYVLPELKSGNATFSNNTVTGVSLEWESDGNFNTTGKGIFKKDILNDKKAGATLGTAFLTNLFNSGVVSKYKAPELKNITINEDLQKKILEDYYSGNAEAFKEGWERMSPSERYNIFRKTLSELTYSPDEYKDIEKFNTNRAKLLALLPDNYTEITDNMSNAYNLLGGVGLKDIITGTAQENEEQTSKIPTEEELNKLWRQKAIDKGYYTEEAIAAYIEQQRKEYNRRQQQPINELKQSELFDTYKTAFDYRNDYVNTKKGQWWKKYFNINENSVGLDWNTQSKNKYDFSKKSPNSFILTIKDLANQFRRSGKYNTYLMRGIFAEMIRSGIFEKNLTPGGVILPGSEDYNDNTAVAFVSTQNGDWKLKVISLFDFADRYGKKLNESFRKDYREANGIELPEDWLSKLNEYIDNSKVQSEKEGGILKLQSGDALFQNYNTDIYDSTKDYITFRNLEIKSEQEEALSRNLTVEDLRKEKQKEEQLLKSRLQTINDFSDLSFSDKTRIASFLQDIGAFGASFVPVYGTITSGILGTTSAITDFIADANDPSATRGLMYTNLGINLGLAGVGAMAGGKAISIGKKILKWTPKVAVILAGTAAAPKFLKAVEKGRDLGFDKLNREDWKDIYYGFKFVLQGGAGAVRGRRALWLEKNMFIESPTEVAGRIKTKSGNEIPLSKEHLEAIKGKTNKEAAEYLKTHNGSDGTPLLKENEQLAQGTIGKIVSWGTRGKLGKLFFIEKESGEFKLKTPEQITEEYNGRLPGNYIDYMMRNPDAIPREQFNRFFDAIGKNPNTMYRLAKAGLYMNLIPLILRLASKTNFTGKFARLGGVKDSPFKTNTPQLNSVTSKELTTIPGERVRTHYEAGRTTRPKQPVTDLVPVGPVRTLLETKRPSRLIDENSGLEVLYPRKQMEIVLPLKETLLLELRNVSSGNTSKLLRGNARKNYIKQVNEYLKDDNYVLAVDREGIVLIVPKTTKLLKLNVNTKVKVGNSGLEMTVAEAMAKGYLIKFNKKGGFINRVVFKFLHGGQHSNVLFANPNQWHKNVYLNIKNDLLDKLKNAKTFEEKLKIVDAYNNMQTRHQSLYNRFTTNGQLNKNIYADEEVGKYQNDIIDDYDFVNSKGITTLWNNNAYSSPYKRSPEYGADGYEKDGKMSYGIDRFYGAQTDDRRILGRVGDFTDEELLAAKKEWLDAGAEMYDDNGYYKLRLNPGNQPENTSDNQLPNNQQPNDSYKDPVTGETMTKLPDGTYKSVGNENTNPKSKILKIGEDVVKYIKNINPADAIALGRALWGENVNNRITDLVKQMGVSLNDPQRQNAILHGDYTAKMLAQELAGKINAATARPTSSDAGLLGALKIEAALKAQEALKRGNLEDSEMYWKTLQILNQVNNENAANEVAVGNENRSRVTAAANNRLQAEAARLSANFLLIWQPFLEGVEKRYRDEDVLRRLAEIDNWKYKITNEHEKKNDLIMENYRTRLASEIKNWTENNPKYKEYNGDFWTYFTKEVSPVYLQLIKENSREMYNRLYEGLSEYYSYIPFQLKRTPDLATQPIIAQYKFKDYSKSLKSGGTLSAAERQALKTTNEINKNIRQAARETYKNIREDKREHRKAMALVSQLSADLIKRAIG